MEMVHRGASSMGGDFSAFSAFSGFDASAPVAFFSLPLPSQYRYPAVGRGVSGLGGAVVCTRGLPRPPTALAGRGRAAGRAARATARAAAARAGSPAGSHLLLRNKPRLSFVSCEAIGVSARGPSRARSIPGSRAAPWPARSPSRRKDSRTGRAAAVSSRTGAPVGLVSILVNFPYLHDRCPSWPRLGADWVPRRMPMHEGVVG